MSQSTFKSNFLRAVRTNNLAEFNKFIQSGIDIHESNSSGLNALHLACKEGHIEIVTELIKRGAVVDQPTRKGNTALHIASLGGQTQVVEELLKCGADVNSQSQNGFTPLYMAAQENHLEIVHLLLNNGAVQSISTEDGFTPLAVALQQGHHKVVAILLENDNRERARMPAIHIAVRKDDVRSVELLAQSKTDVNKQTEHGFTPLHVAAHYGSENAAALLIKKGSDVNFQAKNNITPLHVASKLGRVNVMRILLDNGAYIDAQNRDGLTSLHCASRSGHEQAVRLLLNSGADITIKTKNGLSPFHMSVQGDHVTISEMLLQFNSDLDDQTLDLLTPLHVASHCGNLQSARFLLTNGCQINLRALNGFTPLHVAVKKMRDKIVQLLLRYNADVNAGTETCLSPLHIAAFLGYYDICIMLLKSNANMNQVNLRDETPLHLASRNRQLNIIQLLVEFGANVNAKAQEDVTPLHMSSRIGHLEGIVFLLRCSADVKAVTKDGNSCLHLASREGRVEVVDTLLENGADLHGKNIRGFTPLSVACRNGRIDMVRKLLSLAGDKKSLMVNDESALNGLSPLHVAVHFDHLDIVQLLLDSGANINGKTTNGFTPMHIAAKRGLIEMFRLLVEYSQKNSKEELQLLISVTANNGFTPLHLAAQEGKSDIVRELLIYGQEPDPKSLTLITPLHLAAAGNQEEVAEILLANSVNICAATSSGHMPLHVAALFGRAKMTDLLLKKGHPVDALSLMGNTPLHMAAQEGQDEVVNVLLSEGGADPNILNKQGLTPAHLAFYQRHLSIYKILCTITTVVECWEVEQEEITKKRVELEKIVEMLDEASEVIDEKLSRSVTVLDSTLSSIKPQGHKQMVNSIFLGKTESTKYEFCESNNDIIRDLEYLPAQDQVSIDKNISIEPITDSQNNTLRSLGQHFNSMTLQQSRLNQSLPPNDDLMFESDLYKSYSQSMEEPVTCNVIKDSRSPPIFDLRKNEKLPSRSIPEKNWDLFNSQNVTIIRNPIQSGFLVSFLVDARGGVMNARRISDLRILVPSRTISSPTRVICRLVKPHRVLSSLPLNDGYGFASRILEIGPRQANLMAPILFEVPFFASLRGRERELVIFRSDDGEIWKEHSFDSSDEAIKTYFGPISDSFPSNAEMLDQRRIVRILTQELPVYFAVVSRLRQDAKLIGPDGDLIVSANSPKVQASFPKEALQKKIKVALQAQSIDIDICRRFLRFALHTRKVVDFTENDIVFSPIVSIEPRRRKFHKPIQLIIPQSNFVDCKDLGSFKEIKLFCSISGGSQIAQWDDITESSPLNRDKNCLIHFATTVSARFWVVSLRSPVISSQLNILEVARQIYEEANRVPYYGSLAVYGRRRETESSNQKECCDDLRAVILLDSYDKSKTLEQIEEFQLIALSPSVELIAGQTHKVELVEQNSSVDTTPAQRTFFPLHVQPFCDNRSQIIELNKKDTAKKMLLWSPDENVRFVDASGNAHHSCAPLVVLSVQLPSSSSSSDLAQGINSQSDEIMNVYDKIAPSSYMSSNLIEAETLDSCVSLDNEKSVYTNLINGGNQSQQNDWNQMPVFKVNNNTQDEYFKTISENQLNGEGEICPSSGWLWRSQIPNLD